MHVTTMYAIITQFSWEIFITTFASHDKQGKGHF